MPGLISGLSQASRTLLLSYKLPPGWRGEMNRLQDDEPILFWRRLIDGIGEESRHRQQVRFSWRKHSRRSD
ncbi:hypothetical protein IMZ48_36175 [Candidatus Bathyarchaeota archaeon]|nr:hypothetical protein [Candidatus Bathyarchaeota archaeon]